MIRLKIIVFLRVYYFYFINVPHFADENSSSSKKMRKTRVTTHHRGQTWLTTFFQVYHHVLRCSEKVVNHRQFFSTPVTALCSRTRYSLCLRTFFCVNLHHFLPVLTLCCAAPAFASRYGRSCRNMFPQTVLYS